MKERCRLQVSVLLLLCVCLALTCVCCSVQVAHYTLRICTRFRIPELPPGMVVHCKGRTMAFSCQLNARGRTVYDIYDVYHYMNTR